MSFVGKNIKKIRKVNKLNQSQFAEIFNLSRSNIGSYEEERAEPKTDSLIRIAKHFSIPIEILITKEITLNDLTHFKNSIHENQLPEKTGTPHGNYIPFIPINEVTNYLQNYDQKKYLASLNHLCLPLPENIRTRAFQLPTPEIFIPKQVYNNDDLLIGSFVNKKYYLTVPKNQPYIVVSSKRIICTQLNIQNDQILLKNRFETTSIQLSDIKEIWTLIGRYENMITPTNNLTDRVTQLEERLAMIEQKLDSEN